MKLKIFILSALAILSLPVAVHAASFSLRLGQPKTPTNQNNFRLTFVALDTVESGRQITVKCFKKGPTEAGFSQFDTDKVLIPGGNTDYCDVTSSILNQNGTYSFYVSGTADSETINTATINVDFNTSGPSTPVFYAKERLNDCDYKIRFKTADDGKTVKVQLFRSDNLNIGVDSGSVISTLMVGPNTEGQFVNSVPQCGKDYYYVIRAVDSSDNASGTVGDSFTTTTTSTTTSTSGNGSAGQVAGGAISINPSSSQVNPANGESATGSSQNNQENINVTPSPTPEILGTSTDNKNNFYKWVLFLVAVFIAYFVSGYVRKSKSK